MSVVSAINILLRANTTDLNEKLAVAEVRLHSFGQKASNALNGLKGIGELILAGVAGFSLESQFEEIEKLARVSERLDIPVEKLAGLKLAANVAGQDFEELTSGLQKMLIAVSKASHGNKEASDTFMQLGVDVKYLKTLAPEDQFALIADKLQAVSDVADRVNLARSLFGRGGVPILNVIQEGSEGLAKWQRAAEGTGQALGKMDVDKIRDANEAVKLMWANFKGLVQTIVVGLAPAIKVVSTLIRGLSAIALDFWTKWGKLLTTIIEIMIAYRTLVWSIIAAERAWAVAKAIWAAIATGGWGGITKVVAQIGLATGAVVLLNKAFDALEAKFKDLGDIKLPKIGDAGAMNVADGPNALATAMKAHPAALQKGSVAAYSAIISGGSKVMDKIEKHTKRAADHLQNIAKGKSQKLKPALIGGGR